MACGRVALVFASLAAAFAALFALPPAFADPVKVDLAASDGGGYARLIFSMGEYDEAHVRQAGNVLIISFRSPIDLSIERLAPQLPDYIGGARRAPGGKAVRLALKRTVTINAMPAGEKYFVDLLPEGWSGLPPPLPQDVVDALARRARDAEKLAERERRVVALGKLPPVHVHVATQPTFTRYVLDVPEQIAVAVERGDQALTLTFEAPLKFDLGDAVTALPATVSAIEPQARDQSTALRFSLAGKPEVRTFRDDKGYVVDVVDPNAKPAQKPAALVLPQGALPQPAAPAPAPAPAEKPAQAAPPAQPDQQSAAKPAPGPPAPPAGRVATAGAPCAAARPGEKPAPGRPAGAAQ